MLKIFLFAIILHRLKLGETSFYIVSKKYNQFNFNYLRLNLVATTLTDPARRYLFFAKC
jgi:hypothetical protein